jgi:hypothetical protein
LPGVPRGELPVIKHRQLTRQIGAFGDFAIESSTDLKINAVRGSLISHGGVLQQPYGLVVMATTAFRLPATGLHLSSI